ncbi:AAA family ATPase [Thioalkalivibrio paradoxus]|uniref:AAA family ATPase n=1 Tax=Thioalkalivibrio paradoxus TaxID=108010 RepID=UPI000312DD0A|nr:ATP-binding protein [Thioalkalivibrio paradoxus]
MLVPLGGHREFVSAHGLMNDALAEALDLGEWVDPMGPEYDPRAVRLALRSLHAAAERSRQRATVPERLRANTARLAALVGLSDTDRRVLEFAVLIHNERLLDDTADYLGPLSSAKVFHALAAVLELPEREVRAALGAQGLLTRSGLLTLDRSGSNLLRAKLDLLSQNFADHLLSSEGDPVGLLRDTIAPSRAPTLAAPDHAHVESFLAVLRPYLRHAVRGDRRGVNVFLYGAPGTGKTELARLMAQELGSDLFEVAAEDEDGDPIHGERRLRAFRAAQSFLAQQPALLLFDEVEDVFNDADRFFGRSSTAQNRKAWINRMLEDNPVPTLWLANAIDGLDPAFVRRFDLVFELPIPPRSQRERILRAHAGAWLSPRGLGRIAEAEGLAPAVITRAAAVVGAIQEELGTLPPAAVFEQLLNHTLQAQRQRPVPRESAGGLPEVYDPAFIHADADLAGIAQGLAQAPSGRLCLYGPPGTGKTAYARWFAEQLGQRLRVRRASDLLSMWLGESEQRIAAAFREAEQENAVLLIDEIDSFLQDRDGAHRSWEVTLVNEMLTQMEGFPGVFIAATNRMDGLDPAALRRFDLKVRFDFLRAEQARELLRRWCRTWGLSEPGDAELEALGVCDNLTPGDFAAVARRHRFHPLASPAEAVAALAQECALKDARRHPIGFRHTG